MTEGTLLIRGLEGVVAAETKLCDLDGANGRLAYCGYNIDDLASKATFEEVCHLLWHGELPKPAQLDKITAELIATREIPAGLVDGLRADAQGIPIPCACSRPRSPFSACTTPTPTDNSHAANLRKSARLTSQMATAICAHHRVRQGQAPVAAGPGPWPRRQFPLHADGRAAERPRRRRPSTRA